MPSSIKCCEEPEWKSEFKEFLHRKGRGDGNGAYAEGTISSYVDYVEKIAVGIGKGVDDLACNAEQFADACTAIDAQDDWSDKTKSNYKTALGRFAEFKQWKKVPAQIPGVCAIMAQVNEIEKLSREHEDKAWRTVFGFMTAYVLAVLPFVFSTVVRVRSIACVVAAVVMAFIGVGLFVPVLLKPWRQLREIQKWGEKLVRGEVNEIFFCPSSWTPFEKYGGIGAGLALLVSVLLLGMAKFIDVFAK